METRIEVQARGGFRLSLEDGEVLGARRVAIAAGLAAFARRPRELASLSPGLASHTVDHADLSAFAGRRVAVVGAGQSALESAALLRQAGAEPVLIVRAPAIRFVHARAWLHRGIFRVLHDPSSRPPLPRSAGGVELRPAAVVRGRNALCLLTAPPGRRRPPSCRTPTGTSPWPQAA